MRTEVIAYLLDAAPPTWRSQEDFLHGLCRALVKRNVLPLLVFARPLPPEIEQRFRSAGAEVAHVSYGEGAYHYYRQLGVLAKKHAITLAHIIFFDYFSIMSWLVRLQGIRGVIYEQHNSGTFGATSWKRSLLRLRARLATQPVSRFIAISEFVKKQLVAAGINEREIVVRHLGVDTERFAPDLDARREWAERFSIRPDEVIISTVSYLRAFKNAHVIVEACGLLAKRGVPFRLIVAGGGELLGELKEQSRTLGIAERTHWLGDWPDPKSLLQASDIFVLASVGEAFGLVLTEAMACGVSAVGSEAGAIPELIEQERTGLLATPMRASSFADALELLARNTVLREQMGKRAMERARQHFAVQKAVDETMLLYKFFGK